MINDARKQELQAAISQKMENNEEFCKAMVACNSAVEMQNLLKEQGIEITVEEINAFQAEGDAALKQSASRELSAEDLENVAGGGWLRKTGRFLAVATIGAGLGFACGVCPLLTPHATVIAVGYSTVAAAWVSQG